MDYIKSFLWFLKHGPMHTSNTPVPNADRNIPQASCRGWSRPDPHVRLRVSNNETVRIFGFRNEADIPASMPKPFVNVGNGGPPLLYLRGDVPAYVNYIMGEDWKARLQPDPNTGSVRRYTGGQIIPRQDAARAQEQTMPEDVEATERYHCLLMRRCGAIAVRSEVDIVDSETGIESWPQCLLGWPLCGGVWILRSRPVGRNPEGGEIESSALREMTMRLVLASETIKEASDMDTLCRILQEAGGEFYPNSEDCPEVKRLELQF